MTIKPLKIPMLVVACIFSPALAGCAKTAPPAGQNAPGVAASATPSAPSTKINYYKSSGVVVKTDPKFPSIELDHEEIKGLMPAMRMEFYVKDKALLEGLKKGDQVLFTLEDKGGAELITEIKKK
jgi:protein SCO1/2